MNSIELTSPLAQSVAPTKSFLVLELVLLFGIMPLTLLLPIPPAAIAGLVLTAISYCIWVGVKHRYVSISDLTATHHRDQWLGMFLRWAAFATFAAGCFYMHAPEYFFKLLDSNQGYWVFKTLFYLLISVVPQEYIYRVFLFQRYKPIISNQWLMVATSAVLFSYAHVVFLDTIVFGLTFFGGILFAVTWLRSKSLWLVSLEHGAYGLWLFSVGAGQMLGFKYYY